MRWCHTVVLLILVSCAKGSNDSRDTEESVTDTTSALPSASAVEVVDPSPREVAATPDAGQPAAPVALGGAFAQEAAARSHAKPEVEEVIAEFTRAKLPLGETKQGLARTSLAQFCTIGTSPAGSRAVICEYADAESANIALPKVRAQMVDPGRRVDVNGRLMLTVMSAPAATAERDALFAAFAAVR